MCMQDGLWRSAHWTSSFLSMPVANKKQGIQRPKSKRKCMEGSFQPGKKIIIIRPCPGSQELTSTEFSCLGVLFCSLLLFNLKLGDPEATCTVMWLWATALWLCSKGLSKWAVWEDTTVILSTSISYQWIIVICRNLTLKCCALWH